MILDNNMELENIFKGGGSFCSLPPLFKGDGSILYIAWRNKIHLYSTKSGKKLLDMVGMINDIVGYSVVFFKGVESVFACSNSGQVLSWNAITGHVLKRFKVPSKIVKTFHFIDDMSDRARVIVTWPNIQDGGKTLGVVTVDLLTFKIIPIYLKMNATLPFLIDVGVYDDDVTVVAVAQKNKLNYLELKQPIVVHKHSISHLTSFTSLRTHPTLPATLLTGDTTGKLTTWHRLTGGSSGGGTAVRSTRHWHTLPPRAVAYSSSGTQFLSGGEEAVLVRWEESSDGDRRYLPRLPGGGIRGLAVARDNVYVAVVTEEDGVHVIDYQFNAVCVIRQMVLGSNNDIGLIYDDKTKCIILNGSVGHVQYYSPVESSLLYMIDVVGHNKLTDERGKSIGNILVKKVAVDKTGLWMATVEERQDTDSIYEIRLKFWYFDTKTRIFKLNTSIEYPHEKSINGMEFRPPGDSLQLVTISDDATFKVWNMTEEVHIDKVVRKNWQCITTAYYKDLVPRALSFSRDSSLLAVSFGSVLTAWLPDSCEMRCALVAPPTTSDDTITHVAFTGDASHCHLLVAVSRCHVTVWNLLSLCRVARVRVDVAAFTADPSCGHMALITSDKMLYIFEPASMNDAFKQKISDDSDIVAAVFVPEDSTNTLSYQQNQLYYLNSKKELHGLRAFYKVAQKEILKTKEIKGSEKLSNFSRTLAEKLVNTTKKVTTRKIYNRDPTLKDELKEILDTPLHTMPPLSLLACSFLHAMVLKDNIVPKDKTEKVEIEKVVKEVTEIISEIKITPLNKIKLKSTEWVANF